MGQRGSLLPAPHGLYHVPWGAFLNRSELQLPLLQLDEDTVLLFMGLLVEIKCGIRGRAEWEGYLDLSVC